MRRMSRARESSQAIARRSDLLAAARAIFSERGYHETTVEDITRAAGVAKGTFYLYFSEKREIFLEIIRELLDAIRACGAMIRDAKPGEHPLAFVGRTEEAAMRLIELFQENRALVRVAYRESMGMDPTLDQMMREFYRETAELDADAIRVAQDAGIIRRECDPMLTAYAHIGMIERVLLTLIETPEIFPDPRELIRQMIRLGYEGMKPASAPAMPST